MMTFFCFVLFLQPSEGQLPTLPSKQLIMKAVALLNVKIKQAETEASKMEGEVAAARRNEIEERNSQRQKILEEEAEKVKQREQAFEELKQKKKEEHESKLKDILLKRRVELEKEQKQANELLETKIKVAQEAKRKVLEGEIKDQIQTASHSLDQDIAKARKEYDRVYQAATKSESEAVAMEAEFRQKQISYKGSNKDTSGTGSLNQQNTSEVVARILAENQRKAAEGHSMCFFFAEGEPKHSNDVEFVDPKFHRTAFEWNAMTKAVTGPGDALYNEPVDAPYFEQNEKTHKQIGRAVKEYVREKKRKLDSRMMELAEEYDYRKRKYAKYMHKFGHHAKHSSGRASMSVSRQSILGGKPASSSSTPANILGTAAARASSNPYRRARRGNEVRSEYEQEQIIAELAAKEGKSEWLCGAR